MLGSAILQINTIVHRPELRCRRSTMTDQRAIYTSASAHEQNGNGATPVMSKNGTRDTNALSIEEATKKFKWDPVPDAPPDYSNDPRVQEIPLAAIRRPLGKTRANNQEKVEVLKRSILEIGLVEPIDILEVNGVYWGFSGCHRFQAHQELGKETILCRVRKGTPQTLRLHGNGCELYQRIHLSWRYDTKVPQASRSSLFWICFQSRRMRRTSLSCRGTYTGYDLKRIVRLRRGFHTPDNMTDECNEAQRRAKQGMEGLTNAHMLDSNELP